MKVLHDSELLWLKEQRSLYVPIPVDHLAAWIGVLKEKDSIPDNDSRITTVACCIY